MFNVYNAHLVVCFLLPKPFGFSSVLLTSKDVFRCTRIMKQLILERDTLGFAVVENSSYRGIMCSFKLGFPSRSSKSSALQSRINSRQKKTEQNEFKHFMYQVLLVFVYYLLDPRTHSSRPPTATAINR